MMKPIYPGVFRSRSLFANQFILRSGEQSLVIDVGLPGFGQHLLGTIQKTGADPHTLAAILITHADGDHFGALAEIRAVNPAPVYASPQEAEAIQKGVSSRALKPRGFEKFLYSAVSPLYRPSAGVVDHLLEPGQILPFWDGLQVLDTRGHTPQHVSFFAIEHGVLFSGDSIQIAGKKLLPSSGGNTWDEELAKQSFEMQLALHPAVICGGHGIWVR